MLVMSMIKSASGHVGNQCLLQSMLLVTLMLAILVVMLVINAVDDPDACNIGCLSDAADFGAIGNFVIVVAAVVGCHCRC